MERTELRSSTAALIAIGPVLLFLCLAAVRAVMLNQTQIVAWFDIDYAIPFLVAILASRAGWSARATAALLFPLTLVAVICDIANAFSHQYGWGAELLGSSATAWPDMPWRTILPMLAAGLAFAMAVVCAGLVGQGGRVRPLIAAAALLVAADLSVGTTTLRDVASPRNVVTSGAVSFGWAKLYRLMVPGTIVALGPGDTLARRFPTLGGDTLLDVAVESLGVLRDPALQSFVLAPIRERLGARYRIEYGDHGYQGATFAGEVRELCSAQVQGVVRPGRGRSPLDACLPQQLARRGWNTVAVHGNGGRFYARDRFYPVMGFRRALFFDDLRRADPRIRPCSGTPFGGACDRLVLDQALTLFDGRPTMVHVVTLDGHLPYSESTPQRCPARAAPDPNLCRYISVARATFESLAHSVAAARNPPDVVAIYGDHAPPFVTQATRAAFLPGRVPFLLLVRRPAAD